MGHPSGEPADALQLLRLEELVFEAFAFRDVRADSYRSPLFTRRYGLDMDVLMHPAHGAIGAAAAELLLIALTGANMGFPLPVTALLIFRQAATVPRILVLFSCF